MSYEKHHYKEPVYKLLEPGQKQILHNNESLLELLEQVNGERSAELCREHQRGAPVQSVRGRAEQVHKRRKSTDGRKPGVSLLVRLM